MAAAQRITGANAVILFVHSGGTANLTGDQRSLTILREQELADATAGSDAARVVIPTVKKFSARLETHFIGTAGSALYGAVALGAAGTVLYGPAGSAVGKPKGGFPAVVRAQHLAMPFDDVVRLSIEFEGQGAEVFNPLTAVW